MQTTINPTDYTNLASLIFANGSVENETIEIEYSFKGFDLFVAVDHEIEHTETQGGSFEGYDFEMLDEVSSESYQVATYECYTKDGECVKCNFKRELLSSILNNLLNN